MPRTTRTKRDATGSGTDALDELYRGPPEDFVAGRDKLASELRAAGDRDEAQRVKKLRRPSAAASLLNRVALESPERLKEFASAVGELEAAQERMLAGEDDGAERWREAASGEREAAAGVVEEAGRLTREAGRDPSERALEQVGETLTAAVGDPELRERVLAGRLEREQAGATLGTPAAAPQPRRRGAARAERKDTAAARRDLKRLERELAAAEEREQRSRERAEKAAEALREEKSKLAERRRATADLRRQVAAAERRAKR
jgi:hypothetical protein